MPPIDDPDCGPDRHRQGVRIEPSELPDRSAGDGEQRQPVIDVGAAYVHTDSESGFRFRYLCIIFHILTYSLHNYNSRIWPRYRKDSVSSRISIRVPSPAGPFFCRDRVPATGAGLPAAGSTATPRGPAWHSDTKCSPKWAAEHAPVTPLPDNGIALPSPAPYVSPSQPTLTNAVIPAMRFPTPVRHPHGRAMRPAGHLLRDQPI